jgi:hypothetical protein
MAIIAFGRRLAVVLAASFILLLAAGAAPATARAPIWSHRDARVCSESATGRAQCTAIARSFYLGGSQVGARTEGDLARAAAAAQTSWFHGPDLRTAYGITAQGDPSRVVAIVDAYDDPSALANLTRFRSDQGLPAIQSCSLAQLTALTSSATSPCFTKTNQSGGTSLPAADSGWSNEIDLDLQITSSICPTCSILLLEATSSTTANLGTAVTTAASTSHVVAISNSYGISGDYPGTFASAWDNAAKKGIAVTASAGDGGYGVLFPASATNVIGVGGTTLSVDASGVRAGETVWAGTGSGCSVYNAAPTWQAIPGNPCAGKKAVSDLSADADPNSGLAIYTTYSGTTGYWVFGGTSLAAPLVASFYAIQGGYDATTLAAAHAWAAGTPYYDVTSGSNGTCSPAVLCTAGTGWDGPTGRGSISTSTAAPVLSAIKVSPASATVPTGGTQQFSATATDQFGQALSPQPTFSWSVSGGGSIDPNGLFTAGSAAGGPFSVTASSGAVSGTAGVTVTAPIADFSIVVSPTSQSVSRGGSAVYTVTITALNGFSGSVTLSLSGQPSGSTVTFSPNPATGTSTLTIKTRSTTTRRSYGLTIKGVSGSLSHATSATLTVTR